MADASYIQSSFLGGEFSQSSQGHSDEPNYRRGLNLCKNWIPIEEGAAVRRPGTLHAGLTRRGSNSARAISFDIVGAAQYDLELTPSFLRIWNGNRLVTNDGPNVVTAISNASPAQITLTSAVTWSTGDSIYLDWTADTNYLLGAYVAGNRQFVLTKVDTTHFTIKDQLGNNIDGSKFSLGPSTVKASRIAELGTPWSTLAQINAVRLVQSEYQALMLSPGIATQLLQDTSSTFSLGAASFIDGPYLDPPKDGSSVQASGTSGSVTLTFSTSQGFTSANVGQLVRLLSEPPAWVSGNSYTPGNAVTYNGAYYECVIATGTVNTPDTVPAFEVNPALAQWAYAKITAVSSGTQVTATLFEIPFPPGPNIIIALGGPLLYTHNSGNPIHTYQMGLYWGTTWPTCGSLHEGRIWLAGAVQNRSDASVTNGLLAGGAVEFMPTLYDGTVADDNGISAIFDFPETMAVNDIRPTPVGVLHLCQGAEVMVQASNFSDPITPYSVQAHQVTRYGSAGMEAVQVGFSTLFVERYARKVLDFAQAIFGGRIAANNVSLTGKHLIAGGVNEIRYQRELAPLLWVNTANGFGNWVGMTYKREDSFSAAGPLFAAWHRHQHGEGGRYPISLATGALPGGATDTLCMVTQQGNSSAPDYNVGHVELMSQIFYENESTLCAWQLDDAIVPYSANVIYSGGQPQSVQLHGFWHGIGNTITAFIAGMDCGDYVVQSDGSITVPFAPANTFQPYFTFAALEAASGSCNAVQFIGGAAYTAPTFLTQPAVQSYVATVSSSNIAEWSGGFGPGTANIFGTGPSNAQTYLSQFNFSTGALISTQNINTLGVYPSVQSDIMYGADGNVYSRNSNPGTVAGVETFCQIKPTSTPYVVTNSFGPNGDIPNGMALVNNMTYLTMGSTHWVVGAAFEATGSSSSYLIEVFRADTGAFGFWGHAYSDSDGGQAAACAGPQNASSATAYWTTQPQAIYGTEFNLGSTVISNGAQSYNPSSWPTPNGDIASTKIKTYMPHDFDSSWTAISFLSGPAYDQTDGNVIVQVSGTGGGNANYIAKLAVSNGAVLWKVAIAHSGGFDNAFMSAPTLSRIQAGTYYYWDGTAGVCHAIETSNGTDVTQSFGASVAIGQQVSDDQLGAVYGNVTWSGAGLTLLNSTASSGATMGAVYFANGQQPLSAVVATAGAIMGYTYNSDLQLLRPQIPQDSGARNGPGTGKTRRIHKHALQLVQCIAGSLSAGSNFNASGPGSLKPLKFTASGKDGAGPMLSPLIPFSGIWRTDTGTGDDYSFDGMLAVRIGRPYPATIAAASVFLDTQDI